MSAHTDRPDDDGADVTMTTLNTVYDGPSVTLSSGTWLVEVLP